MVFSKNLFFIGLGILIFSCDKPKSEKFTEIHYIDFTSESTQTPGQLQDIATDIRVIKLETRDDVLLSYFNGHVGENFIVSLDRDKILLFDTEGKFIRKISQKGNGPEEFNDIDAWAVDQEEKYLYYRDQGKNHIKVYDLGLSMFLSDIPFEDHGSLDGMISFNDSVLAILPGKFADYGYLYFFQNTAGEILSGKRKEDEQHPGAWAGMGTVFRRSFDQNMLLQSSDSDSVFLINKDSINTFAIINKDEPIVSGYTTTGKFVGIEYLDSKKAYFIQSTYEKTITTNSASMNVGDGIRFSYDLSSRSLTALTPFTYNFDGFELELEWGIFEKYRVIFPFSTIRLITQIEAELEKLKAKGMRNESLESLRAGISEDDNPYLIVGKLK